MHLFRSSALPRLLLIIVILFAPAAFAHAALLFVEDNADGSIYIEAGISTGESAEGALIFIKDKTTGQTLSRLALPDSGKLNLPMPAVPYTVTLDMGEGHQVTKTGPLKAAPVAEVSAVTAASSNAYKKPPTPLIIGGLILFLALGALGISLIIRKPSSRS